MDRECAWRWFNDKHKTLHSESQLLSLDLMAQEKKGLRPPENHSVGPFYGLLYKVRIIGISFICTKIHPLGCLLLWILTNSYISVTTATSKMQDTSISPREGSLMPLLANLFLSNSGPGNHGSSFCSCSFLPFLECPIPRTIWYASLSLVFSLIKMYSAHTELHFSVIHVLLLLNICYCTAEPHILYPFTSWLTFEWFQVRGNYGTGYHEHSCTYIWCGLEHYVPWLKS